MNERVRLLGGVYSIESVPGAGTTVSASIPAWRPLAGS
jgi:signal transduction histidine kinase